MKSTPKLDLHTSVKDTIGKIILCQKDQSEVIETKY